MLREEEGEERAVGHSERAHLPGHLKGDLDPGFENCPSVCFPPHAPSQYLDVPPGGSQTSLGVSGGGPGGADGADEGLRTSSPAGTSSPADGWLGASQTCSAVLSAAPGGWGVGGSSQEVGGVWPATAVSSAKSCGRPSPAHPLDCSLGGQVPPTCCVDGRERQTGSRLPGGPMSWWCHCGASFPPLPPVPRRAVRVRARQGWGPWATA